MEDDFSNVKAGGTAADRAERLTRAIRDQSFPNVRPRDSATLILIDRATRCRKCCSAAVITAPLHARQIRLSRRPHRARGPADGGRGRLARPPFRAADATGETAEPRQGGGFCARRGARNL